MGFVQTEAAIPSLWHEPLTHKNLVNPSSGRYIGADADLAVGPTRILVSTNWKLGLSDKDPNTDDAIWTMLRDTPDQSPPRDGFFVPTVPPPDIGRFFDTVVYYDAHGDGQTGRFWIVSSQHSWGPFLPWEWSHLHIGVSRSDSPMDFSPDHWFKYEFDMHDSGVMTVPLTGGPGGVGFADRMTFSVDADNLYISMREGLVPQIDNRTVILIIPKAPMIDGTMPSYPNPPTAPFFSERIAGANPIDQTAFHLAVDMKSATADPTIKQYFITSEEHPAASPHTLQTRLVVAALVEQAGGGWSIVRDYVDLTATPTGDASWHFTNGHITTPDNGNQGGVVTPTVFHQGVFINGSLWTCHNVQNEQPVNNQVQTNFIRWYQIAMNGWPTSGSTPSVVQWGDIVAGDGLEAFDGSIAVNSNGTACMTYQVADANVMEPPPYPSIWRAFRTASDPLGTFPSRRMMRGSQWDIVSSQQFSVDFTATEVDPSDPCLFWGHAQLVSDFGDPSVPTNPEDHYHTWLMRYNVCDADTADFSGDGVISAIDEVWFEGLYQLQHPDANFTGDKHLNHHDWTAAIGIIRIEEKK